MRAIPSGHGYFVIGPDRQPSPSASFAGARSWNSGQQVVNISFASPSPTCMKAVATITPEPKYLATKNAHAGTPMPFLLAAKTGNHVPRKLPTRMTKMAEMRVPMRPSYPFPVSQAAIFAEIFASAVECELQGEESVLGREGYRGSRSRRDRERW